MCDKPLIEECELELFRKILEADNLSFQTLIDSLNPDNNRESIRKAGEGSGGSGSFFFFASDGRFIVKTITQQEKQVIMGMLADYVEYLKRNPSSLLARIYGIFTVTTTRFKTVTVMVMENTARLRDKSRKMYEFDLKGSVEGRLVKPFKVDQAMMYMY